jgi:hypothetical protein
MKTKHTTPNENRSSELLPRLSVPPSRSFGLALCASPCRTSGGCPPGAGPCEQATRIIVHLFLLYLFASLGFAADTTRHGAEDAIREAVFRWQFDHNISGQQQKAQVYFLSIGEKGGDPSDAFMKRFADRKPPVRKKSACTADAYKGVWDKQTGEEGLILRVTNIKWNSDTEVEVTGGFYAAGASASGNTYTLKKEKGKWKVTKDKTEFVA